VPGSFRTLTQVEKSQTRRSWIHCRRQREGCCRHRLCGQPSDRQRRLCSIQWPGIYVIPASLATMSVV